MIYMHTQLTEVLRTTIVRVTGMLHLLTGKCNRKLHRIVIVTEMLHLLKGSCGNFTSWS